MKARLFNYLITLTIVGLALWAAVSLYYRCIEHPWTRDGQVRANIVGIAPRVSGPIIRVAVRDNQQLRREICFSRSTRPIFKPKSTLLRARFSMMKRLRNSSSKTSIGRPTFIKITLPPARIFKTPRTASPPRKHS